MGSITPLEKKPKNRCRRWRLFVSCGTDENGKRIQKSERFTGTYADAKKELAQFEVEAKQKTPKNISFGEFADIWREARVNKVALGTSTGEKSHVNVLKHILGATTKLSEINGLYIDDKFNEFLDKGGMRETTVDKPYVRLLFSKLNLIFEEAKRRGYLLRNPCDNAVGIEARITERTDTPTAKTIARMLESLDCVDGRQMCVYLCASLGLRRGEALGLCWDCIDFEKNTVAITRSLQLDKTLGLTKTIGSERVLPMPPYVAEKLKRRKIIVEERLKGNYAGTSDQIDDITVCCKDDCTRYHLKSIDHWWSNTRKKYDIECSLHGLRHALLTSLAEQNVHPRVMAAIAGHSDPSTTLRIYTHTNMSEKQKAFNLLSTAIAQYTTDD